MLVCSSILFHDFSASLDADYRETQSRTEYAPGDFNQTDTAYGTITSGKDALISTVTDARGKVTRTTRDGLRRKTLVVTIYVLPHFVSAKDFLLP